ncbi:MAG: hypothetical protein A4E53_02108 [Pelotomaculum sp. PtaB.Bin104]|nr:MAG: hypothetical protein A4E53_02108 [Pelotomaculum sp. PtaB.Bin104]
MPGKFQWCKFQDCDLNDSFFDSLKEDYSEFPTWFSKKSKAEEEALVFKDEQGIGAFVYLKSETEAIELLDKVLPAIPRIKIGTLRLAERFRKQRLGEGAIGVSLWRWQEKKCDDIYVTVFEKHDTLINLFEYFGFKCVGMNRRGERVYLKSRNKIDYSDPYKAFPFINPNFNKAGLIPIDDHFHDRLFPYSELFRNKNLIEEITAGNGVTKVYIGSPFSALHYYIGEPVVIYRIFNGTGQKTYKSVATSFCVISKVDIIKSGGVTRMSLSDFIGSAGNKTVFTPEELTNIYTKKSNVVMLEMTYNGFFGKGHNIIHKKLKDLGLWFDTHPYNFVYSKQQFLSILEMGDKDVQNIIIN